MFARNLNLKKLFENASSVQLNCRARRMPDIMNDYCRNYERYNAMLFELSQLQRRRNELTKEISRTKSEPLREPLRAEVRPLKSDIQQLQTSALELRDKLVDIASTIPNDTHPSVPTGDEPALIEQIGKPRPTTDSLIDHVTIATNLDICDFTRAAKVSGSGFYFLKNMGAILELALVRYAMDVCVKNGFTPTLTPDLIRSQVLDACGFSPRSDDPQTYFIESHSASKDNHQRDPYQHCLTATAEFPLAAMHANEIVFPADVPKRYAAFSHCFRAEGMAGALNRGLYRVHQFSKVEMFALCLPAESDATLLDFVRIQKEIFESLGLCFRILNMPVSDLGAPAYIKYDMEAYFPVKGVWGEISSTSNCTDFQARRLGMKYFGKNFETNYLHTVNGTAIAVPRIIMALLENFQNDDGSVTIPEVLRPYMYQQELLAPKK
jgi:seryl-tRNA synthetase